MNQPVKKKKRVLRQLPLASVLLLDLLVIGMLLIVFALFHHVLSFKPKTEPVAIVTATPAPTEAPVSTESQEVTAEPEIIGDFSKKFADKFTDGEVISTEDSYQSANLNLSYTRHEDKDARCIYHVVEIYVRDIHYLRTAFSNGEYYKSTQFCEDIAKANKALAALSGDYYYARKEGAVVRNGVLYRDTPNEDVCVIWQDGSMECIPEEEYDPQRLIDGGAWQAWGFGPSLMENGQAIAEFDHPLNSLHPRSALGYVEPGHYFFVMVEGRSYDSKGMSFEQLSELFASLGCVEAYNLDGGQSANMCWNEHLVNVSLDRPISDIIYVAEDGEEAEG